MLINATIPNQYPAPRFTQKSVSGLSFSAKKAMMDALSRRGLWSSARMENPSAGWRDSTYTVEWKEWA